MSNRTLYNNSHFLFQLFRRFKDMTVFVPSAFLPTVRALVNEGTSAAGKNLYFLQFGISFP